MRECVEINVIAFKENLSFKHIFLSVYQHISKKNVRQKPETTFLGSNVLLQYYEKHHVIKSNIISGELDNKY